MSTVSLSLHRVWPFASGAAWRLSPLPSVGRQVPCLLCDSELLESLSSRPEYLAGPGPNELVKREVRPTDSAERTAIELGIAGIGFGQSKPHSGDRAARLVHVGAADRTDEAFLPFGLTQHDVALLLAGGGVNLAVIGSDR